VKPVPFTPFHLGPALLLGMALLTVLDLPALLVASVAPDVEPFAVLNLHVVGGPAHGFLHTYLGSSFLALLVASVLYSLRGILDRVVASFRISQRTSFKKILLASFVGVYSHVALDSFLYEEMVPFYPFGGNPFLGALSAFDSYRVIYGFCSVAFLLGVVLYLIMIVRKAKAYFRA